MRFFRRKPQPQPEDRRKPENAELRRHIDFRQKQATEYELADSQIRIDRNAERVARLEKVAEVLTIRHARKARDS